MYSQAHIEVVVSVALREAGSSVSGTDSVMHDTGGGPGVHGELLLGQHQAAAHGRGVRLRHGRAVLPHALPQEQAVARRLLHQVGQRTVSMQAFARRADMLSLPT